MKMFKTLDFKPVRPEHWQAKQQFGKYQLSVVLLPGNTLYEAAVFDDDLFVQEAAKKKLNMVDKALSIG